MIVSSYISCSFGRGFDTPHLHKGELAQLARAPALHAGGHQFDSDILHIYYGGDWIWQGDKDIMKINALIGTQIKSVKAGTFAALAAIRLLATEEVAVEENVLALAA